MVIGSQTWVLGDSVSRNIIEFGMQIAGTRKYEF